MTIVRVFSGVDVYEADLGEDDISGVLKYESGKYSIIVNNTHVPERQRFTIAHELGHLMQVYEGRLKLEDGQRVNRSPRERYTDSESESSRCRPTQPSTAWPISV